MSDKVEHHWHEPTQGQVVKALYQYFSDKGIDKQELVDIANKKVEQILQGKIDALLNSGRFDQMIINAVAHYIQSEKEVCRNNYGFHDKLRKLIEEELSRMLTKQYKVSVEKVS